MPDCLICHRIDQIRHGVNPYFIAELETGYVVAGDHQYFKGYTLFLCKEHVPELHQLDIAFKLKFLEEMSLVAEAVFEVYQPQAMNYEALGNSEPHLHWHLFPRYANDPNLRSPIWKTDKALRCSDESKATTSELFHHKDSIARVLANFAPLRILSKFD